MLVIANSVCFSRSGSGSSSGSSSRSPLESWALFQSKISSKPFAPFGLILASLGLRKSLSRFVFPSVLLVVSGLF